MPQNYEIKLSGNKKALGNALLGLGVVFLVIVAYSAVHINSQNPPANSIKKFSSLSELQSYLKENSDSYGYPGGVMRAGAVTEQMSVTSAPKSMSDSNSDGSGGSPDFSNTNIQVDGVDEADVVKNDGKYIYTVSGTNVYIVSAVPAEGANISAKIESNDTVSEIFVNGDKLIVFGQSYDNSPVPMKTESKAVSTASKIAAGSMPYRSYSPNTDVKIYDISDRSNPALLSDVSIEGNYYDSRMIGNYVYVIANQQTYYMYDANQNVTVPEIYSNGRQVSSAFPDIYYFDNVPGNVFTTVASINLDNPSDVASKILLTNYAQNIYVSEKNIYVVYTKWMSDADYLNQMVDIILPLVPSDVQDKINAAMALEISKQTKMQAVGEILQNYVASLSPEERKAFEAKAQEKMNALEDQIAKEREKTVIQKIAIDNGNIEYKASGEVPGNTLNQFSMDENNGYFRIATTTSGNGRGVAVGGVASSGVMQVTEQKAIAVEEAQVSSGALRATGNIVALQTQTTPQNTGADLKGARKSDTTTLKETPVQPMPEAKAAVQPVTRLESQNNVYVLDENLKIVGKLEDLASGERIYSVRFLGEKAYLVTFRQIDPLFVIDLSVPENPAVLGYLKIPGVSDYLHPYDETHVIGIGRDATEEGRIQGMKISLFDVSDVQNPKEISKYLIGERGTDSEALYDHKAFLFSKDKNLLVIPVSEYSEKTIKADSTRMEYIQPQYEQSAYVFNIDLANGISLKGKITHENTTQENNDTYYYDYLAQIHRSLYIDNTLYTISQKMIKMNSLDNLGEINRVDLPLNEATRMAAA